MKKLQKVLLAIVAVMLVGIFTASDVKANSYTSSTFQTYIQNLPPNWGSSSYYVPVGEFIGVSPENVFIVGGYRKENGSLHLNAYGYSGNGSEFLFNVRGGGNPDVEEWYVIVDGGISGTPNSELFWVLDLLYYYPEMEIFLEYNMYLAGNQVFDKSAIKINDDDFGDMSLIKYVPGSSWTNLDSITINTSVASDDIDGDGVLNTEDNCPRIANADQSNLDEGEHYNSGDVCDPCTDTDGDFFGNPGYPANACFDDNCPLVYNVVRDGEGWIQPDTDGDGIGDACEIPDIDGDGIPDDSDNCIDVANPGQENTCNMGIGDACQSDADSDNIPDACDNCIDDANSGQSDADGDDVGDVCDNCVNYNPNQSADVDNDTVPDACDADTIYGTISGVVKQGVDVQLYEVNCAQVESYSTITDLDGYYAFGNLVDAQYLLGAYYAGLKVLPNFSWPVVPNEENQTYDLTASDDPNVISIKGTVTGIDLTDFAIKIYRVEDDNEIEVDVMGPNFEGYYSSVHLLDGTYRIVPEKPGLIIPPAEILVDGEDVDISIDFYLN